MLLLQMNGHNFTPKVLGQEKPLADYWACNRCDMPLPSGEITPNNPVVCSQSRQAREQVQVATSSGVPAW